MSVGIICGRLPGRPAPCLGLEEGLHDGPWWQNLQGKTLTRKTLVGKTLVGNTLVGKTLVGKTLVGKTLVGKTLTGRILTCKTFKGMVHLT